MSGHDGLLRNLAAHLRAPDVLLWTEPNLNGWAMGGDYGSPDVLTCPKSYSRFTRRIYEVKDTTSDLTSDLRKEKWTRYLPICDRLTFAVSEKVEWEKHLRPLPVGIMVLKGDKWRTVRAAPPNLKAEPWPETMWMALLFGRMGVSGSSRLERLDAEARRLREAEIEELRFHPWKKLQDLARSIRERESDLEERERRAQNLAELNEHDHRRNALTKLYKLVNEHPWASRDLSEEDLFERWARRILDAGFTDAKQKLLDALKPAQEPEVADA